MGNNPFPRTRATALQIREVRPGVAFIIEMPIDAPVLLFEWLFDAASNDRTRIMQRVVRSGANATADVNQVETSLGSNLPDAVARIAATTAKAARLDERS